MVIINCEKLRPHFLPIILVVLTTSVVYARILEHDFLNLDDKWYVTMNPAVAGFTLQHIKEVFRTFYIGNYAPVQMLSYMLDYTIWGMQPGGFLLSNLIIHIANGLIAYRLFIRFHGNRLFALVATEIFLLHPVQVETVAWISQRKNLLAMLFFLLAWEYYCRYRETLPDKRKFAYFLSLALFVLALLSKSVSVILPVVLVMYDFYYFEGKQRVKLVNKLPFIVAAGITSVITMYSQLSYVGEGGRVAELHGGSALATFFTMMPVFCRYLGMIFWPSSLSADYNPPIYQSLNVVVAGSFLIILSVFWGGWRLYRHERRIAFWVPFFFVALLPVSQIVPLFTLMNDRYLYFPMLSVAALAGFAASVLKKRCNKYSNLVTLLILLPLLSLSILTYNRAGFWRNSVILWSDATSKVTDCARIWGYMGNAYDEARDRGTAIYAYSRGLAINPNDIHILYNTGSMYLLLGDNEQAYSILKKLMDLAPTHIMGLVAFGDVSLLRGDYAEAKKSYFRANQLQPNAPDPLIKLGNLSVVTNRLNDALGYYLSAEEVYTGNPEIAYNIACVESMFGRVESSLYWLDKALQRGYKDEFTLRSNEELMIVREDARFEQLISRNLYSRKSR